MQVNVQKLTITTFPARFDAVTRGELIHSVALPIAVNSRGACALQSAVPKMPACAAATAIAVLPRNRRRPLSNGLVTSLASGPGTNETKGKLSNPSDKGIVCRACYQDPGSPILKSDGRPRRT